MILINISIKECILSLQKDIREKEKQLLLLQNIDLTEKISEDVWHNLCETPFRSSDELGRLVQNLFPNAVDITVCCNYVYFTMYGFKIQIPTSRCRGINIDTNWYFKYDKPKKILTNDELRMNKYFECLDQNKGWHDCAKYRLGTYYKKWYLFILWWGKYKWKNDHRIEWEERFKNSENNFQNRIKLFNENQDKMNNKVILFVEKLLPELNRFSELHYNYNGNYAVDIKKIINEYNGIKE